MVEGDFIEIVQDRPVFLVVNKNNGKKEKMVLVECCECKNQRSQRIDKFINRKTDLCLRCNAKAQANATHSLSHTRIYQKYMNMLQRCYNPDCKSFKSYGGRGIGIELEWLGVNGFINFYNWSIQNGWTEDSKNQIDRVNNEEDYGPNNCEFISQLENLRKVENLFGIKGMKVKKEATENKSQYADIVKTITAKTDDKGQVLIPLWDWLESLGSKNKKK